MRSSPASENFFSFIGIALELAAVEEHPKPFAHATPANAASSRTSLRSIFISEGRHLPPAQRGCHPGEPCAAGGDGGWRPPVFPPSPGRGALLRGRNSVANGGKELLDPEGLVKPGHRRQLPV